MAGDLTSHVPWSIRDRNGVIVAGSRPGGGTNTGGGSSTGPGGGGNSGNSTNGGSGANGTGPGR